MKKTTLTMIFLLSVSLEINASVLTDLEAKCDNGDGSSCEAAIMYALMTKDYEATKKYAVKACDKGIHSGCLTAGIRYLKGEGTKQDYKKALHYLEIACAGGNGTACYTIANMYDGAKGVQPDNAKIKEYYIKSCELPGTGDGCAILGALHLNGEGSLGFKKDRKKAKVLFKKACDRSDKNSKIGKTYCKMAE